MGDLISREAAKEAVRKIVKDLPTRTEINTLINGLPSAEPKRKTGKWMNPKENECYKCSECKKELFFMKKCGTRPKDYKFCPNCGTEMEAE